MTKKRLAHVMKMFKMLKAAGQRGVTPLQFFHRTNSMHAAKRIYDLRRLGIAIETHKLPDAHYCIYVMTKLPNKYFN